MEGYRELHNEELSQDLFSWAGIIRESQIKEDELGGYCSTHAIDAKLIYSDYNWSVFGQPVHFFGRYCWHQTIVSANAPYLVANVCRLFIMFVLCIKGSNII